MTDHHHPPTSPQGWQPTPRNADGDPVEQVDATYDTITENVKPYRAGIGGRVYLFDKRPSADLQLQLMEMRDQKISNQHAGTIRELLQVMVADGTDTSELFRIMDLAAIARLINDAVTHMSKDDRRPTTGRPGSSPGPSATTSTTGSPAPASAAANSAG